MITLHRIAGTAIPAHDHRYSVRLDGESVGIVRQLERGEPWSARIYGDPDEIGSYRSRQAAALAIKDHLEDGG